MQRQLRRDYLILCFLFLFVLAFRLYFAFRYDHFNTDGAYFHLRHIQYFLDNNSLLSYDDLSYGGRFVFYPPLFHVVMAVISFGYIPILKFVPELLFALIVFIVYKISYDISGSSYSSLFAAGLSAFIPMLFVETLNNLSVYSFVIPLLLFMLYSIVRLENRNYFWLFVIASFLLPLTHPSAIIFTISIFLYFFLIAGGAFIPTRLKKEAAIFSVLLIVLLQLIIYKKAFLEFGANILKENIPSTILADSFRQLAPLDLLVGIGLLPLVLGSVGIYVALIREKKKIAYMFGAFVLAVLILVVLRLLTISIGLMFLGIALSIFSASGVSLVYNYFNKFKFDYLKYFLLVLLFSMFILLSVSPSFIVADKSAVVDNSKIKEIKWLADNTNENDVILAGVEEGNLIESIAKRKTVVDSNFLFAPKPIERVGDVDVIYKTVSQAIALKLLHKYNVDVIYLSDDTRRQYGIIELAYTEKSFGEPTIVEGSACFDALRRGTYYVVKC